MGEYSPKCIQLRIKTTYHHIITYEETEESLFDSGNWPASTMMGCGSPSVIKKDGYYYMIYHVRTRINYGTAANPVYVDSGYFTPRPSIAIARAYVSDIEHAEYEDRVNYWKKYKEVTTPWTNAANWVEDGIGGVESVLWNTWMEDGKRTQWINWETRGNWRAFPKVSENPWAAAQDIGCYMMICKGKAGTGQAIYIHNSDNLIDWTYEGIVVSTDVTGDSKQYPTLIGDSGSSTETSEYNMMYYQRDYNDGINRYDLYRQTVMFDH